MTPDERSGGRVACWPSSGGVWVKNASPVELEWLGLPRFNSVERQVEQKAGEEDVFCAKLQLLGEAKFWKIPLTDDAPYKWDPGYVCEQLEDCYMPDLSERWIAGLPEHGGIWILDLNEREYPVGMLGLWNAFTMEERCRVSER
jgi:hypothetical protein